MARAAPPASRLLRPNIASSKRFARRMDRATRMDNGSPPGFAPPRGDSMPTTPRLPVPAGATDCHMHIYGPADRYPVAPSNPSPVPFLYDLEAYRKVKAVLGLSRTVIVQPTAYGDDNACTLDAVA